MTVVLYAVEGPTDAPIAEKLIRRIGRTPRVISATGGSSQIDSGLKRWSQPSNRAAMLVLRDWDDRDSVPCAPALVDKLAPARPNGLSLRIAVRSLEAWLMADVEAAKRYFGVRRLPTDPEQLPRPKVVLVAACRKSTRAAIREGMATRGSISGVVGPQFVPIVTEFARDVWDPDRARLNAPSLDRTLRRLEALVETGSW